MRRNTSTVDEATGAARHALRVGTKKTLRSGDKAALLNAASGSCYNPGCVEPLVVWREARPVVNFDIAHIRDELPPADPDGDRGWRYWPAEDMSQDDRNRFENLCLLCKPCHKLIDQIEPRSYSVDLLRTWKRDAERGGPMRRVGALAGTEPQELAPLLLEALAQPPELQLHWPRDASPTDSRNPASVESSSTRRSIQAWL